uniref:Ankyrin repeat domain 33Ab n=1 Tax=Salmo trutta TaxID=8032 RepID=A0A673YBY6_SALTR
MGASRKKNCRCGADLNAVDTTKQKCARDWALKTGRYETLNRLRRLNLRPRAEQFAESYVPEWPELKVLVAKAMVNKSAGQKITQRIKSTFGFNFPRDPQENGVLDHMVRITTSIHSPLVATGCRPLCPTSPPEVGKRRLAVPELVKKHSEKELGESSCAKILRFVECLYRNEGTLGGVAVGHFCSLYFSKFGCHFQTIAILLLI